jgi:DNA topoisomerase-2
MYLPEENKLPLIHSVVNNRWEVGVSYSDGHADQVSFVNSIATTRGGTHLIYIMDQICKRLVEYISKKYKSLVIKPQYIKNHLFVFINCLIDNPKFDTQTKSCLTTKRSEFGSTCELSDKFIKDICKSSIVENIVLYAQYQSDKGLKKNDGKKQNRINVPKLEDANDAGGKNSSDCTIILTEGIYNKTLYSFDLLENIFLIGSTLY